jgi:putative acetyltransferase
LPGYTLKDGTRIVIRPETLPDIADIRRVNLKAFESPGEAELVEKLRSRSIFTFSFVALKDKQVVGHIMFSPVTLDPMAGNLKGLGLGPVAVLPGLQKKGIGALLIRHGLEECRKAGYDFVALLGHPEYYRRFGFVAASKYGIKCEYDAPVDSFMLLELRPGVLSGHQGTVKYQPEFNEV